jgi:hypothetical protein
LLRGPAAGARDLATLGLARRLLSPAGMKTHMVFQTLVVTTLLVGGVAQAQQQQFAPTTVSRSMNGFPGKDELSGQLGFQASLGGGTPGGFKMFFDYSHRLTDLVWLNFKFNPTFGVGSSRTICYDRFGNAYDCGLGFDGNGYAIDILGGVKLKWMTRLKLMPYVNIDAGVVPVFSRPYNDDGAAVVLHTGGGLKYFVHPRVGVGGEIDFTLGPGFYSGHTEFYRAFNLGVGAEFIL